MEELDMRKISYILGCICILLGLFACSAKKETQVTATFYVQEDSFITKKYNENAKLTKEDFPTETREGFEPGEWYLNEQRTSLVFFPYTITTDTSFYLKWIEKPAIENQVTIQLIVGDEITKKVINKGSALAKPNDPSQEGSTFKGWSTAKDTYQEFDFTSKIEKDTTLYAHFEINQYSVAFYNNKALYHVESVSYNQTVNKPQNPSLTGKLFKGWSTDEATYQAFDFNSPIKKDLNLYAHYENSNLSVEFYVQNQLYETKTVSYDQLVTKPQDPVLSGHLLEGWYLEPTFKTKFNFDTPVQENLKLYANMVDTSIPMITVNYHIDGQLTTRQIEKGSVLAQPQDPSKVGYTFKGWSTSENTYISYPFTEAVTATLDLYAFFDINQYTVQFSVQGKIDQTQKSII